MTKLSVFLLGTLIGLSACQKSDNGGNSGTVAQTPENCNIPGANVTACNPGYYNQNGWQNYNQYPNQYGNYGYSNGFDSGFCGCPIGTVPVMNPGWGIGCAPMTYGGLYGQQSGYGGGYGNAYSGWSYPAANTQILNQPTSYYSVPNNYANSQNNCHPFASQACDVRLADSCAFNGVCVAVGGGSTIGICQMNNQGISGGNGCTMRNLGGYQYRVCSYGYSTGNTNNSPR